MKSFIQDGTPRSTILIVDDDSGNLDILSSILQPHFNVLAALSGERALQIVTHCPNLDIILLDVLMPVMDGYDVLARLQDNATTSNIPVIFVTGLNSIGDEERCLELGAADYIAKPYRPSIILARVRTHLELKHASDLLVNQNAYLEEEIVRRTREILLIQDVTINALGELAETRDPETGSHIRRTQEYVRILATHLQAHPRFSGFLTDKAIELLVKSAPLHDIGKVGIPDHILLKPGKLTDEEWRIMKTHTLLGAQAIERAVRIVAGQSCSFLDFAKQIAHYHHEKWDGGGYPDGKKGEDIPIPARLMALADVFDALITKRVYKLPMPIEQARDIIADGRGRHFDPDVVDAFMVCFAEFVAISQQFREGEAGLI
jgi:putative two-component system response regulator